MTAIMASKKHGLVGATRLAQAAAIIDDALVERTYVPLATATPGALMRKVA
jgi:hypothetical protein